LSITTPNPVKRAPAGRAPAGSSARKRSKSAVPMTERPGLVGKGARLGGTLRRLALDWLDRPMTSLHLVLAIFALMLGFGLLMVLSSSSVAAFRTGGSSFSVFANQATYAAVGLIFFAASQFVPVRLMRSISTIAVIVSLILLVGVLVPGLGALVNGSRSWIRIGGFQFQPSEIAKLALLLWMAHVLAARRSTLSSPKALLIPVLPVFGLMAGLIMLQPDLGTTVALTIVFMAVLFFAGAPWWMFGALAGLGAAAFVFLAVSADYRLARLLSFINPEDHPASSYQLLQSLYGIGNGGWFGVGLGQSRAKWSYLPNADSDFIFAIIGEELGLIGAGILILLFALLAYTGLRIARRNVDPFVKIVASGATVWLVGQAAINIGYVVGLLPVTGIPLPMISAGGTSLLITMVVFGLLANFARREPQAAAALHAGGGSRVARFLGIRQDDPNGPKTSRAKRKQRGRKAAPAAPDLAGPASRPGTSQKSRTAEPQRGRGRRSKAPATASVQWAGEKRSAADRQRQGVPPRTQTQRTQQQRTQQQRTQPLGTQPLGRGGPVPGSAKGPRATGSAAGGSAPKPKPRSGGLRGWLGLPTADNQPGGSGQRRYPGAAQSRAAGAGPGRRVQAGPPGAADTAGRSGRRGGA